MKITESKSKFTISLLTFDDLVKIHNTIDDSKIESLIYQKLKESLDEDKIFEEFGVSVDEYLINSGLIVI